MDTRLEMDQRLKQQQVEDSQITDIALQIANFHAATPVVQPTFRAERWSTEMRENPGADSKTNTRDEK